MRMQGNRQSSDAKMERYEHVCNHDGSSFQVEQDGLVGREPAHFLMFCSQDLWREKPEERIKTQKIHIAPGISTTTNAVV